MIINYCECCGIHKKELLKKLKKVTNKNLLYTRRHKNHIELNNKLYSFIKEIQFCRKCGKKLTFKDESYYTCECGYVRNIKHI